MGGWLEVSAGSNAEGCSSDTLRKLRDAMRAVEFRGRLPQALRNKPPPCPAAITYAPTLGPSASGASSSCINTSPIYRAPSVPTTTPVPLPARTPLPFYFRPILADTRSDVRHVALPPTCPVPPARTGRSSSGATPTMRWKRRRSPLSPMSMAVLAAPEMQHSR